MEGKTIIHIRSKISSGVFNVIDSPTTKCKINGIRNGASNVSINIMASDKGRFPLLIVTQMTLVTPVGTATEMRKPIVKRRSSNIISAKKNAHKGMRICRKAIINKIVFGYCLNTLISRNFRFKLLMKVMTANNNGTRKENASRFFSSSNTDH